METYKITLKIKSSIITPFQSDTIFGSFCWALKYLKGEEELEKFLTQYSKTPPLIVSNGFPEGFFPRPILKPLSHQQSKQLIKKNYGTEKKNLIRGLDNLKTIKKQKYISIELFNELKENLSEYSLLDKLIQLRNSKQPRLVNILVFRNTINRFTNTVISEGGFHPEEETFYPEDINISIFVKTDYFNLQEIKEIFDFIAHSGFGKSKSVGKGELSILNCEEYVLPHANNPNAFFTISSFVPKQDDPIHGYYSTMTKYGKLGGDYAKSAIPGFGMNPFKKPLLMFEDGSVFFDSEIKEYYGRLISQIHMDKKIKHCGYAFPIGVKVNENL